MTTEPIISSDKVKRAFDFTLSLIALIVLSPVLIAVALIIKFGSPGPVFYRGLRIGLKGRPFHICKFRTMVIDAEKLGGSATAEDDPRITPIGKFLRRHKLDELPQFLNVFFGDMSLVGPRPEVEKYVQMYNDEEFEAYRALGRAATAATSRCSRPTTHRP